MRLNLPILWDHLPRVCDLRLERPFVERPLLTFSLLEPGTPLREDVLYVIAAAGAAPEPGCPGGSFLVLPGCSVPDTGDYLSLEPGDGCSCAEILACLSQIFHDYSVWEAELETLLLDRQPLPSLCNLALQVFGNPILVHDAEYGILALAEPADNPFTYDMRQPGSSQLSESLVKDLTLRKDYLETFDLRGPAYWLDDDEKTFSLYRNLFAEDGTYLGRIIIDENHPFSHGAESLLEFFSRLLESSLQAGASRIPATLEILKNACLAHLDNPSPETRQALTAELQLYGWKPHDRYFCIHMHLSQESVQMHMPSYESLFLDHYIPHCLTLYYQDELILLFNLTQRGESRDEICTKIAYVVRENLLRGGVSTEFSDFLAFPQYFQQARAARITGGQLHPTQWLIKFETVALDHLLLHGSDALPLEVWIPASLQTIQHYDQVHGTELFHTLEQMVLYGRNTSAMEALYVHRSTLQSRMKRILEMVELDLSNADTRLYLKAVFHLLKAKGGGPQ